MSESRAHSWRTYVADVVLLLVLCLLFFWRGLTPVAGDRRSFAAGDFGEQFYAFAHYEAQRLQAGQVPLWNPYTYAGHPFQADIQSAIFYPPSLATIALSSWLVDGDLPYRALELEALLHFPLVAISMYLLARRLTGSRVGGVLAAVIFTFGGYLTSYPPLQLAILEVLAWLPLILLLLDVAASRAFQGKGPGAVAWILGAGLLLGVSTLAGHPQSTLLMFYGTVAFLLYRLFLFAPPGMTGRGIVGRLGLVALFVAVGVGLAAVQLLPSWEFMGLSTRASAGFEELGGGFTPYDLIQLVLPAVGVPFPALYVGILSLGLAAAAVIRYLLPSRQAEDVVGSHGSGRMVAFWLGIGALSLLLSFGKHLPVYQVFYLLFPGWDLFRHQERVVVGFVLAVAMLAGYGGAWLASGRNLDQRDERLWRGLIRFYGYAALAALAVTVLFFVGYQAGREALWGFTTATLFLALLLGLSALAVRSRRPVVLLAILVLDLFTLTVASHTGRPIDDPFPPLPVLAEAMTAQGAPRVANQDTLPANYGMVYGLEDLGGASPLQLAQYEAAVEALSETRLWRLLNVQYLIDSQESPPEPAQPRASGQGLDGQPIYLAELPEPGPRAWLADQVIVEPDPQRLWQRLAGEDFDLDRQVLLPVLPDGLTQPSAGQCDGQVDWQGREPEQLVLQVTTERPCVLVLAEQAYPGWQATVDGQAVPVLLANGFLRAVALEAGTHRVEMRFQPPLFAWGAGVSVVVLLVAVIGLVLAVLSSRQNGRR
jgi:hypothetical protein